MWLAIPLLATSFSWASSTPEKATPNITVELLADPVCVSKAHALNLSGKILAKDGHGKVGKSEIYVFNSKGAIVFKEPHAFQFSNPEGTFKEIGTGFASSGGGADLPNTLPAGHYSAIWTVDDVPSNSEQFDVGISTPPSLVLEAIGGSPGDPRLALHFYNGGKQAANAWNIITDAHLTVDGKSISRISSGIATTGDPTVFPGYGSSFSFSTRDYVSKLDGKHSLQVEFAGAKSNTISVDFGQEARK